MIDLKPSTLYKLNVSHLDSPDLHALCHHVWNLGPCPIDGMSLLFAIVGGIHLRTIKFMHVWGHIIVCEYRRGHWRLGGTWKRSIQTLMRIYIQLSFKKMEHA